jgi:uncharacterized NAD-dependent epimerase/dehydratase family protein
VSIFPVADRGELQRRPVNQQRRTVILAEGSLGVLESKTACCVIRYRPEQVVAVLDSRYAGKDVDQIIGIGKGIPILSSVEETSALSPTELLIGIAPRGGELPEEWKDVICRAIEQGMDIVSGLHTYLCDIDDIATLAAEKGVRIWDIRKPPPYLTVGLGRARDLETTLVLTVGTDCDVGKMTVAFELHRAAREMGIETDMVATGQTGVYLSGKGVVIDSVKSDFIAGAVEEMVLDASVGKELLIIEGQGSLLHPGYSAVTLGLIHGSMPDGFVLCHLPSRVEIPDYGVTLPGLRRWINLYESSIADIKTTPVLGIALNCYDMDIEQARDTITRTEEETGLPVTDPIKFGMDRLMEPIRKAVKRE